MNLPKLKTILLALAMPVLAAASVPASVTRAVKQVNDAASLSVTCSINGQPAELLLSNPCFSIDLGKARIVYDGKTQWSYNATDREVTILNPTPDELNQANPLLILRNLANDFNGTSVKGKPNAVRLTPLDPENDVAEATVTFDPTSGWPVAMTLITGSGRAEITNLKFSTSKTKKPASAFTFKAPAGTTITDLR